MFLPPCFSGFFYPKRPWRAHHSNKSSVRTRGTGVRFTAAIRCRRHFVHKSKRQAPLRYLPSV
ncbi:hypothetical protein HMPREF9436_02790 [Faecalibacterium cf. prausnitzii KLE1255]|uniref:Uncharacterized protein n=1 Tax=Faecalibacterium cf. prausnitzii KLE1255 TaxID=748224 RepID=E2ZM76_9FIRM|nr:hypothetical protein HMPREF9436_02790 [Faecalibacterium cf. prausnitzii KLE1255]